MPSRFQSDSLKIFCIRIVLIRTSQKAFFVNKLGKLLGLHSFFGLLNVDFAVFEIN